MIRKNIRQYVYIAQELFYIAHIYMTYKTLTTLFTFTGVITMCLARVEVLCL